MKYILANIKVPIEIDGPKGHFHTYMERASIEFTDCDELPPDKGFNHHDFLSGLSSFLGSRPLENKIDFDNENEKEEEEKDTHDEEEEEEKEEEKQDTDTKYGETETVGSQKKIEISIKKEELTNTIPIHKNNVSFKKTPIQLSSRFTQKIRL